MRISPRHTVTRCHSTVSTEELYITHRPLEIESLLQVSCLSNLLLQGRFPLELRGAPHAQNTTQANNQQQEKKQPGY